MPGTCTAPGRCLFQSTTLKQVVSLSLSLPLSYLRTLGRLADQLGFEARGLQCQECLERTSLKGPHPVPVPMDRVNIAYYARLGR